MNLSKIAFFYIFGVFKHKCQSKAHFSLLIRKSVFHCHSKLKSQNSKTFMVVVQRWVCSAEESCVFESDVYERREKNPSEICHQLSEASDDSLQNKRKLSVTA